MAGKLKSAMESRLAEAAASPQSLAQDTAPEAKESGSSASIERAEAPLDREYLDSKIKLNKSFTEKRDSKNEAGDKPETAKADEPEGKEEIHTQNEAAGYSKDNKNDPKWLRKNNPERYCKLYNADGTKKAISELATDRMERAKKEAAAARKQLEELNNEYQKAVSDKDVVTQKLLEREAKELEANRSKARAERFYEEASEQIGEGGIDRYRELVGYYGSKLKEIPAFEKTIEGYADRHRIMEHILGYIDDQDNPTAILAGLKNMNDRVLARTIRQVDEELKRRANEKEAAPKPKAGDAKAVPGSVVATTPSETETAMPANPTRKQALEHFRKHGTDFKRLLEQARRAG
jgi:hypothetical protein